MGFTDRINDGLRDARKALSSADLRQRLAEAQSDHGDAVWRLGATVHAVWVSEGPEAVDIRFAEAAAAVDEAAARIADYEAHIAALQTPASASVGSPRFCGSCGAPLTTGASFCSGCGTHMND